MKIFVLFSTFMLYASVLYGCIWIDGTTIDGQSISHTGVSLSAAEVFESFELSPSEKLNSVISKRPANPDQEWKAVEAMFSNKPQEAIQILSPLFESAPSYSIAVNLGTAYELQETTYLMRSPANAKALIKSISQLESRKTKTLTTEELKKKFS